MKQLRREQSHSSEQVGIGMAWLMAVSHLASCPPRYDRRKLRGQMHRRMMARWHADMFRWIARGGGYNVFNERHGALCGLQQRASKLPAGSCMPSAGTGNERAMVMLAVYPSVMPDAGMDN